MAARFRYSDVIFAKDNDGKVYVVPNPVITVYEPETVSTALAQTIYRDNTGATTLANPFTSTDVNGGATFFLNIGQRVKIKATGTVAAIGAVTVTKDLEPTLPDRVPWFTVMIDTANDTANIANAITKAKAAIAAGGGGAIVELFGRQALVDTSLDLTAISNITLCGLGRDITTIKCTSALNGSNNLTKNSVVQAINFMGVLNPTPSDHFVSDPANYYENVTVRDLTVDCSLQSAAGIPGGATGGYNLAGIEIQDVHRPRVERVRVINSYGKGVIFGTTDPGREAALEDGALQDVIFEGCVRGVLPQYGITGGVVEIGAMVGGTIRQVTITNPGGPAFECFNVRNALFDGIQIDGWSGAAIATTQAGHIGAFHSDFGIEDCIFRNYISTNAGGLYINGAPVATFFDDFVSTPGPNGCIFDGVHIEGTALSAFTSQPTVPATTVASAANGQDSVAAVEIFVPAGRTLTSVTIDGVLTTLTLSGGTGISYKTVVPRTKTITMVYSGGSLTWMWYRAPNAQTAAIYCIGGSSATVLGQAADNQFSNIHLQNVPAYGFAFYDATRNIVSGTVLNAGEWVPSPAISVFDSAAGVAGTGTKFNTFRDFRIEDTRTIKRTTRAFEDSSVNCVGNALLDSYIGSLLTGFMGLFGGSTSQARLRRAGNYGPGADNTGDLIVPRSAVSASHSTTQALVQNVQTALVMNTEQYDDDDVHSTSVNTSRFVAPATGVYDPKGRVEFASNNNGLRYCWLRVNGSTFHLQDQQTPVTGDTTVLHFNKDLLLTAGDYVEVVALHSSATTPLNVTAVEFQWFRVR